MSPLLSVVSSLGRRYNVRLDGFNFLPHLTSESDKGPRNEVFYFADAGELTALRYQDWKTIFMEQIVLRPYVDRNNGPKRI